MKLRNFKAQYWAIFWTLLGVAALIIELTLPVYPIWPWAIAAVVSGFCVAPALYCIRRIK